MGSWQGIYVFRISDERLQKRKNLKIWHTVKNFPTRSMKSGTFFWGHLWSRDAKLGSIWRKCSVICISYFHLKDTYTRMATRKEGSPYWMIGVIGVAKAAQEENKKLFRDLGSHCSKQTTDQLLILWSRALRNLDVNEYVTNNAYSGDRGQIKETYKQLTLYIQRSSCIFSILLSLHFLSCWRGEFG